MARHATAKPGARHVALLRGVNVGTAKRVAMADLREWLGGMGHGDVRTLLNSGNAVFSASPAVAPEEHARRIAAELEQRLGFDVPVVVKTAAAFAALVRGNTLAPFASNPSRLMVTLTQDPASLAGLAPLLNTDWGPEQFALSAGAAWMWVPDGIIASPLATAAARLLGPLGTTRNWATVQKIHALLTPT